MRNLLAHLGYVWQAQGTAAVDETNTQSFAASQPPRCSAGPRVRESEPNENLIRRILVATDFSTA